MKRPVGLASEETTATTDRSVGTSHSGTVDRSDEETTRQHTPNPAHLSITCIIGIGTFHSLLVGLWGSQRRWFRNTGEKKPLLQHLFYCLSSTPELRILGLGRDREVKGTSYCHIIHHPEPLLIHYPPLSAKRGGTP